MAVFENCSVLLELKNLPFKKKKQLKSAVTDNGGRLSFVVNKQCSLIVTSDVSNLSSNRLRSIQKHQTPVVGPDYVYSCVKEGALLPVDGYKLDASSASSHPPPPLITPRQDPPPRTEHVISSRAVPELTKAQPEPMDSVSPSQRDETPERSGNILDRFRVYTRADSSLPAFPGHFQVAKYSVFQKKNSNTWCVLELQSAEAEKRRRYRVVRYSKDSMGAKKAAVAEAQVFPSTSEEAAQLYQALRDKMEASGLQKKSTVPLQNLDLGSAPLRQLLLEEKLNTGSLSQEVGVFVELLWTEALGCIGNILSVPISKLSLNDVSRAEGLLLQAQKNLSGSLPKVSSLLVEFNALLPHRNAEYIPTAKFISQKLDLCQLIRDVLTVSEMTLRNPSPSCVGKYRALRCSIETVPPDSAEFQTVNDLLQNRKLQVQQVFRVNRPVELQTFKTEIRNVKPLLHSSSPSNFVGILSRGLLLPRAAVEHHGIQRTDVGNLGSGIYFSDAVSTCLKYSKPSQTNGSRLLLVCDVALGRCKDVYKRDLGLTRAPEGHDSVHGVRRGGNTQSEFEDDEYVVYSPDQVKLKYVVQFNVEGDEPKDFSPAINTAAEPTVPPSDQELSSEVDGVENVKDPLDGVTAGLLDSSGQQLPLQAVHVKCKLMDLLSQVIIFQKYTNRSSVPIEAKYVFPLDDSAAVCGFEAFINGKHVVGQVKEKETARKEYKQAIAKGHGAYLMDQDAPDVFTISVGNLPPGATVLIKVTFVSELIVRDGAILFSLPGSVAPWQESSALNQTTQVTVEKVCVTDEAASQREFTLDMSIEMPYEITSLQCVTHQIKTKRTDCKAVLSVLPGEVMGSDGFQLSVGLSKVHMPRMWVENHPDKDSQACMLVFYPDFEAGSTSAADEVVLLLDTSESMKGESLRSARRIALQVLKNLDHNVRVNVILFGTDHKEAFLTAQPLGEVKQEAVNFVKSSSVGGSTELWRPLRALGLLPPSGGVRNLLLLSDGHIQNAELSLKLLRDAAQHSRLFTCGLSPTANRHMLRALAQAGGGAYEFFDAKTKHNWAEKVSRQMKRMASPGCSSVSVKWQQFNPTAPPPVQAPKQLHALFNDCHTLVYGFVPHCTQATLLGNLSGQELQTMVSTSELQKTRGTFLHKLTARALIRDYEDGCLDTSEAEHESKKTELKSFIVELSKEFSILSQFTSFVAIEERDSDQSEDGFTDIPKLIADEDVDILPYIGWTSPQDDETLVEDEMMDWCMKRVPRSSEMRDYDEFVSMDENDDSISPEYTPTSCEVEKMVKLCSRRKAEEKEVSSSSSSSSSSSDDDMGFGLWDDSPSAVSRSLTRSAVSPLANSVHSSPVAPYLKTKFICLAPAPPQPLSDRLLSSLMSDSPPPPPPQSAPLLTSFESDFLPPRPCMLPLPPGIPPVIPVIGSAVPPLPHHSDAYPPPHLSPTVLFSRQLKEASTGFGSLSEHTYNLERTSQTSSLFGATVTSSIVCDSYVAATFGSVETEVEPVIYETAEKADLTSKGLGDVSSQGFSFGSTQSSSALRQQSDFAGFGFRGARESMTGKALDLTFGFQDQEVHQQMRQPQPQQQPQQQELHAEAMAENDRPIPCSLERAASAPERASLSPGLPASVRPFQPQQQRLSKRLTLSCHSFKGAARRGFGFSASLPQGRATSAEGVRPLMGKKGIPRPILRERMFAESPRREGDSGTSQAFKWKRIFQLQRPEGYWELTTELGEHLKVNVDVFANVFLKSKGINSLGVKAHEDILKLVATLLVLQLMRLEKSEEGNLLRTLFSLEEPSEPRSAQWEAVKRAVDWVRWADRQYPCVYSRLEFGLSWESSTRQLLGYEEIPPFSALYLQNVQRTLTVR